MGDVERLESTIVKDGVFWSCNDSFNSGELSAKEMEVFVEFEI